MESALLGLVVDSSVLVAAERAKFKTPEAIRNIRALAGEVPIVISVLTVLELAHGIYRAQTATRRQERRQFLDELKPTYPSIPSPRPLRKSSPESTVSKRLEELIRHSPTSSSARAPWNSATRLPPATSATLGASQASLLFASERRLHQAGRWLDPVRNRTICLRP